MLAWYSIKMKMFQSVLFVKKIIGCTSYVVVFMKRAVLKKHQNRTHNFLFSMIHSMQKSNFPYTANACPLSFLVSPILM